MRRRRSEGVSGADNCIPRERAYDPYLRFVLVHPKLFRDHTEVDVLMDAAIPTHRLCLCIAFILKFRLQVPSPPPPTPCPHTVLRLGQNIIELVLATYVV